MIFPGYRIITTKFLVAKIKNACVVFLRVTAILWFLTVFGSAAEFFYDYSAGGGTDRWAWSWSLNSGVFDWNSLSPGTTYIFDSSSYTICGTDDGNYLTFANALAREYLFEFQISQNKNEITGIYAYIDKSYSGAQNQNWNIWNAASGVWEVLNPTSTATGWTIMQGTITTNCANYVDSGNKIHLAYYVADPGLSSTNLFVDYVRLKVTVSSVTTPVNFSGTAISDSAIVWNWQDADYESGYRVLTSTDGILQTLPANTTFWVESSNLYPNIAYTRKVQAYNSISSSNSNQVTIYTKSAKPTNLAVVEASMTWCKLSWDSNYNPGYTRYGLEYSLSADFTDGTTFISLLDHLTITTTIAYDLLPLNTYYFRCWAWNEDNLASEFSNTTTAFTTVAPTTSTVLSGIALSSSAIYWMWDAISGADSYKIYRATNNLLIGITTNTYYTETGLAPNTPYGAYVRGVNYSGAGIPSNQATYYTFAVIPETISVSAVWGSSATISWTDQNPIGTKYGIACSLFENFITSMSVKNFTDNYSNRDITITGLSENTTYYFRIWAYNEAGLATDFIQIQLKTLDITAPAIIKSVSIKDKSSDTGGAIIVSWTGSSESDVSGYRLYYATHSFNNVNQATYYIFSPTKTITTSWEISGLTDRIGYYVGVVAQDLSGNYRSDIESIGPIYPVKNIVDPDGAKINLDTNILIGAEVSPGTNLNRVINVLQPDQTKSAAIDIANQKVNGGLIKTIKQDAGKLSDTAIEFIADGPVSSVKITLAYQSNVFASISYTEEILAEDNLRIFELDEVEKTWTLVPGEQLINKTNHTVSASVSGDWSGGKVYRLCIFNPATAKENLSNVYCYPNPFRPELADGITFKGLTRQAKFYIYNIAGELVFEDEKDSDDEKYVWKATNNNGEKVASGIYVCLITNNNGEKKINKVAIIK